MPLSGFPELLPGQRFVELAVLDRLRSVFELHGFAPIETPAVESVDTLLRKSPARSTRRSTGCADCRPTPDDDGRPSSRCTST